MNTGVRNFALGSSIAVEWANLFWDARWMLTVVLLCVIVDFHLGKKDSLRRYKEALAAKNTVLADKYRWHTSRAWRRTIDKIMSYVIWVIFGMAIGVDALKPFGIDYTFGGVAATMIVICMCELPSAFGHFLNLYGVHVEKRTLVGFLRAFTVAIARRKDPDFGDALNDGFEELEKEEENHGDTKHK